MEGIKPITGRDFVTCDMVGLCLLCIHRKTVVFLNTSELFLRGTKLMLKFSNFIIKNNIVIPFQLRN